MIGEKVCFVCGRWTGLECHHIFGGPFRKNSDKDGLMVWLCYEHHRGDKGVHNNRELDLRIKRVGQFIYEQDHTRSEFMRRYGKNYDTEETEGAENHLTGETMEQAEGANDKGTIALYERARSGDPDDESEENALSDYWQKSEKKDYHLPRDIYHRVLWLVRGYDRTKEELESLILPQGKTDGESRATGPSDPTVQAAIRRERLLDDFQAVEDARLMVPEEYRDVVFKNVKDIRPFKTFPEFDYAHEQTWKNWRGRFLREVARNKGWWW